MAETSIQWTATAGFDGALHDGFTFNPWIGCQRVSPECDHCYADRGSRRLAAKNRLKLWDDGSSRYFTGVDYWKKPLAWNRRAKLLGVRLKVFCASYVDVFEDREDLVEQRHELWRLVLATPWLDWLLLTKRPEDIERMLPWGPYGEGPTPWRNVWLGTTVGVRASLPRVDALRAAPPAVVKFLSIEPLLEDLADALDLRGIGWVIVGGESGASARPIHPDWARRIHAASAVHGGAFFMKQLGHRVLGTPPVHFVADDGERHYAVNRWILEGGAEWVPPLIGANNGRMPENAIGWVPFDSHGGDPTEWPEDLRVREWPRRMAFESVAATAAEGDGR